MGLLNLLGQYRELKNKNGFATYKFVANEKISNDTVDEIQIRAWCEFATVYKIHLRVDKPEKIVAKQ